MSLLSKALGQSSTASKQSKSNAKIQGQYASLFGGAYQDYKDLHKLFGDANIGQSLGSAINSFNQPNEQKVEKFANGANERAAQANAQTAAFLRSQGFGDGLSAGAGANAYQQAAGQTNAYAADLESPEEQQRRFLALLQSLGGAQSLYLNPLQQFGSGAFSAPIQQSSSPLAGLLGQAAGGYLSGLGGGGGSSIFQLLGGK